jgi:hypothetical protein
MSKPPRSKPERSRSWIVTDPGELAAIAQRDGKTRHTAAHQVGTCPVIDAPLPLLAQYVVELPGDERQEFLDELVARLPADVLRPFAEALRARLDAPAS